MRFAVAVALSLSVGLSFGLAPGLASGRELPSRTFDIDPEMIARTETHLYAIEGE